jgi:predicted transcriptional regulator
MSLISRTVSIRFSDELLDRLEKFARQTDSRRNAIIVRAIEDYLDLNEKESVKAEARRQSLLASARTHPEDEAWPELAAEDSGST